MSEQIKKTTVSEGTTQYINEHKVTNEVENIQTISTQSDLDTKTNKSVIFNVSQANNKYDYPNKGTARYAIPYNERYAGQILAYQLGTEEWVTEIYTGTSPAITEWSIDANWKTYLADKDITNELGSSKSKVVSQNLLTKTKTSIINQEINDFQDLGTNIYSSTALAMVSVVSVGNQDYLIMSRDPLILSIQNNFVELAKINVDRHIGRVSSYLHNGKIHILTTESIPQASTKIQHYTFDIETKELINAGYIDTGDEIKAVWSMIEFKGLLYACLSYESTYTGLGESGNFIYDNCKIELYHLEGTTWTQTSTVAQYSDVWGYKFMDGTMERRSLPESGYLRGTLSTDGQYLYCSYSSIPPKGLSSHHLFTKKSIDCLIWENESILCNARCYYGHIIHYQGKKIYLSKAYMDNTYSYNISDIIFCFDDMFNHTFYSLVPYISNDGESYESRYNLFEGDDFVTIVFAYKYKDGRNNSAVAMLKLLKTDIDARLNGMNTKDRGLINQLPAEPKIGDSYLLSQEGKTNIPLWTYPYILSVRKEYITLGTGEILRITYNGSDKAYNVNTIYPANSRKDVRVFETRPHCNPFFTPNFRIPVVTDSADGTILFATSDIRYTTGRDRDIIQIGFCRSLDNGRTWKDYKIIFKRKENSNYLNRVHDCSMCVDRNPKSTHYGRIWAFAKMIDTDLPESEWEDIGFMTFLSTFSDDNGLTWSDQTELTDLFPSDAFHVSSGVSAGITLKDGTLVQPTYFTRKENEIKTQRAFFIYSLDGETWKSGDITPSYGGESTIIQLANGGLLMNTRDAFSEECNRRRVYTLESIGSGWVNQLDLEVIPTVNCNESLAYNRGIYLYSQPTGYEDETDRSRITIFKSRDLINWEKVIEITNEQSNGYSSLIFRDNRLGILFEDIDPYDIVYSNLNYLLPVIYS